MRCLIGMSTSSAKIAWSGGEEEVAIRQAFPEGMGRDADRQNGAGLPVPAAIDPPQADPDNGRRRAIGGEDMVADGQGLDRHAASLGQQTGAGRESRAEP